MDPKPSWPAIAAAMGEGYTSESVRQQFAQIKKLFKPTNGATSSSASKSDTVKAKTKDAGNRTNAKGGRKRKISETDVLEDDEETETFSPKSRKVKKERCAEVDGNGGEVFKYEEGGDGIDLQREELYEDDEEGIVA